MPTGAERRSSGLGPTEPMRSCERSATRRSPNVTICACTTPMALTQLDLVTLPFRLAEPDPRPAGDCDGLGRASPRHVRPHGKGSLMDLGLQNKVFVVTGGTRGLGFATARALVAEGARVVLS